MLHLQLTGAALGGPRLKSRVSQAGDQFAAGAQTSTIILLLKSKGPCHSRTSARDFADHQSRDESQQTFTGRADFERSQVIYAMLLGADSIDDTELLRAGRTRRLLGGWVAAPSTLGTFLRAFTFGHVRQLDRLLAEALTRAWRPAPDRARH